MTEEEEPGQKPAPSEVAEPEEKEDEGEAKPMDAGDNGEQQQQQEQQQQPKETGVENGSGSNGDTNGGQSATTTTTTTTNAKEKSVPPVSPVTSDPNFAVICSFATQFGPLVGIEFPDMGELQAMLEPDAPEFKPAWILFIVRLLRKLKKSVNMEKWERACAKFANSYSQTDAWEFERFGFKKAKTAVKVRLVKELLEAQFEAIPKLKNDVNGKPGKELRMEPLGRDKMGNSYWYHSDEEANLRVYKEDPDEETWELVARNKEQLSALIEQLKNGPTFVRPDPERKPDEVSVKNGSLGAEEEDSMQGFENVLRDTGPVPPLSTEASAVPSVANSDNEDDVDNNGAKEQKDVGKDVEGHKVSEGKSEEEINKAGLKEEQKDVDEHKAAEGEEDVAVADEKKEIEESSETAKEGQVVKSEHKEAVKSIDDDEVNDNDERNEESKTEPIKSEFKEGNTDSKRVDEETPTPKTRIEPKLSGEIKSESEEKPAKVNSFQSIASLIGDDSRKRSAAATNDQESEEKKVKLSEEKPPPPPPDEAVEEPLMIIRGRGNGAENDAGNSAVKSSRNSNGVDKESESESDEDEDDDEDEESGKRSKNGGGKGKKKSEDEMLALRMTPRRTSGRIAALRIKETERRQREEEEALELYKEKQKRKDEREKKRMAKYRKLGLDYEKEMAKKRKKKRKRRDEESEEDDYEGDQKQRRRRRKKKKHKRGEENLKEFARFSSGSSDEDDEGLEAEEFDDHFGADHHHDDDLFNKSDHEFSCESDVPDDEAQPIKHARTGKRRKRKAKKVESESEEEEEEEEDNEEFACKKCGKGDQPEWILLCDKCDAGYHASCLRPTLMVIPEGDWFCPDCQHAQLLDKLTANLAEYEALYKRKESDLKRKERLAFVSLSLSNIIPTAERKSAAAKKVRSSGKKSSSYNSESESEDEDDESDSDESSSESSDSDSEDDVPLAQTRRRATKNVSYNMREYDDMIRSAISDNTIVVEDTAGNDGFGKNINNIIQAEKKRKEDEEAKAATEVTGGRSGVGIGKDMSNILGAEEEEEEEEEEANKNEEDEDDEEGDPDRPKPIKMTIQTEISKVQ